jgi:formylglycine-generating enzyme required for sulfatase activity
MRFVPAGRFVMGSDEHYPEERPARPVSVDGFWIDESPVTNREFSVFAEDTGHVTLAERPPDPAQYPGILPEMIRAGSLVFTKPAGPVPLSHPLLWWRYCFDACWRRPLGPGSSLAGLEDHPVIHIALEDALAYAAWAGKCLPTEAEWEFAARGGLDGATYAWGDELEPGGRRLANYWEGEFPWRHSRPDGFERTTPVGHFPPNGYGLFDLIGNVWEWTSDNFDRAGPDSRTGCCAPKADVAGTTRKVLKGGSHLCAPNYCRRYRPAARFPQPIDTSTSHVGFRCVARVT